jgi:tetratricopeptide (TPR) repeat protein
MLKAMKLQEKAGNKYYVAACIGNVAVLYDKEGEDSLALLYQKKSYEMHKAMGNKVDMAASLNHLGSLYRAKKQFDISQEYFKEAEAIIKETGDLKPKSELSGGFGLLYYDMGQYDKAIQKFEEGLEIARQLGEKKVETEQLNMLGKAQFAVKKNREAKEYCLQAYTIAKEIRSLEDQLNASEQLYQIYKSESDMGKALKYHELLTQVKDSIYTTSKNATFNNLKMQYALDRQEHDLKSQSEEELKKKEAEKKQQRLIGYIMIVILIIVCIFSYFLFQRFKVTKAQKRIIEVVKVVVEQKYKEVTDSIHYAKRIQTSQMPTEKYIDKNLRRLKK